jgi:hypothetical protein
VERVEITPMMGRVRRALARVFGWQVAEPVASPGLTADPRIERLELRQELERTRARWQLIAWTVVVIGFATGQILAGAWFAIPLALSSAVLGVAFDRWQGVGRADERMARDLRALTTVYHESPRTIRRWLTRHFIEDSIRNLLAAALDSEDLGHGYWRQAVEPFLEESKRGYKSNWRYQIDIADIDDPIPLTLDGKDAGAIDRSGHRRLHTSVSYTQSIPSPSEMYYVAAVFDSRELPEWFKRSNFLLREVADVPADLKTRLAGRPRSPSELPTTFEKGAAHAAVDGELADVARLVLRASVTVGEEELEAVSLHFDATGISWGFRLSPQLRDRLKTASQIRVDLETFMSRSQRYFPVVIAAPTRNPTVQFNYGLTDIDCVETQVFFSAERPWDARLRTLHETYRRVDVLTERDDWVFAGSGCLFAWWDDGDDGSTEARQ